MPIYKNNVKMAFHYWQSQYCMHVLIAAILKCILKLHSQRMPLQINLLPITGPFGSLHNKTTVIYHQEIHVFRMDKRSIKFEIGVQLVPLLGDGMTLALGTGGSYLGERTDGQ